MGNVLNFQSKRFVGTPIGCAPAEATRQMGDIYADHDAREVVLALGDVVDVVICISLEDVETWIRGFQSAADALRTGPVAPPSA